MEASLDKETATAQGKAVFQMLTPGVWWSNTRVPDREFWSPVRVLTGWLEVYKKKSLSLSSCLREETRTEGKAVRGRGTTLDFLEDSDQIPWNAQKWQGNWAGELCIAVPYFAQICVSLVLYKVKNDCFRNLFARSANLLWLSLDPELVNYKSECPQGWSSGKVCYWGAFGGMDSALGLAFRAVGPCGLTPKRGARLSASA